LSDEVQSNGYPSAAFALSLTAGILMIVSGLMATVWVYAGWLGWGPMMGHMGFGRVMLVSVTTLGLISGVIVLVSAVLLRSKPKESTTWGTLILVFSILSFFGMGGFFVGALLGIVGGALALSWKG
jgi:hypothetical protein